MTSNPSWQRLVGRQGRTFAFLGGARLGKSHATVSMLWENTEISLPRALLVPEGVPRAPSLWSCPDKNRLGVNGARNAPVYTDSRPSRIFTSASPEA